MLKPFNLKPVHHNARSLEVNMASRTFVRLAQSSRQGNAFSVPLFLLPSRQNLSTVSTVTTTTDPNPPPGSYAQQGSLPTLSESITPQASSDAGTTLSKPRIPQLSKRSALPKPTAPLSNSLALLPALAAQKPQYMSIHIHARPYLITEGDSIRLPFLMPDAPIGTILRLNRATILGSRDFTFQGDPWVDEQYFVCRAIVTAVEQEPERVKIKKKQRNRRKKTVRSQHRFTVVRIMEARIRPEGRVQRHETDKVLSEGEAARP